MPGYYDLHCHILFGVDDGAQTLEDSMAMLQLEYDSGVRTVYLTPHYRRDLFECPSQRRLEHFEALRASAAQRFPDLRLNLGCEVRVHMDVVDTIRSGSCFTMGDTGFVLLEFSAAAEKRYLLERCQTLLIGGYTPILAHAERCSAIRKDLELLQTLVDMGVYIQMNAGSITGKEGLAWKWFCKKAMRRDLLHFIGSDAHDTKRYKPDLDACARYLERTMGEDYRDRILVNNPREILERSV